MTDRFEARSDKFSTTWAAYTFIAKPTIAKFMIQVHLLNQSQLTNLDRSHAIFMHYICSPVSINSCLELPCIIYILVGEFTSRSLDLVLPWTLEVGAFQAVEVSGQGADTSKATTMSLSPMSLRPLTCRLANRTCQGGECCGGG